MKGGFVESAFEAAKVFSLTREVELGMELLNGIETLASKGRVHEISNALDRFDNFERGKLETALIRGTAELAAQGFANQALSIVSSLKLQPEKVETEYQRIMIARKRLV